MELVENLRMGGEKKIPLLKATEAVADMANFIYVRQKGPYGNGTPIMNVQHIIGDEPFLYTWSDDFIQAEPKSRFKQLIEAYEEFGCSVLASVRATRDEDYDRYGFAGGKVIRDGIIDVETIIEKPGKQHAPSDLANVSGFIFTPDIFDYLEKASENLREDDELYYNDALKLMLAAGERVIACEIKNGKYYDTGNKLEYMKTVVEFALKHPDINGPFRVYLKELLAEK
jgi:UTP--glucose-1-phosphate uridylyltransferase